MDEEVHQRLDEMKGETHTMNEVVRKLLRMEPKKAPRGRPKGSKGDIKEEE